MRRQNIRFQLAPFFSIAVTWAVLFSAMASAETVLHNFVRQPRGARPAAALISDSAGNLYGTTEFGGAAGVVFELTPQAGGKWKQTVLHNFIGGTSDGSYPLGSLALDAAGSLYGMTWNGGTYGCGTAFKVAPAAPGTWKETILHNFACYPSDGGFPMAGLIFDKQGNLYGTTSEGGSVGCGNPYDGTTYGCGAVFELSPGAAGAWTETILYNFKDSSTDGGFPASNLIFDSAGNLYGTAEGGGTGNCSFNSVGCGAVFELTPGASGWTANSIYSFTGGNDGDTPTAGLIFDSAGNLYGTSAGYYNYGAVFQLKPSAGSWTETTLYTFNTTQQLNPASSLVLDSAGNLYGTAEYGANPACKLTSYNQCGAVFSLSPLANGTWTENVIYQFTGTTDGANPAAGLLRDQAGNLYATTSNGGAAGCTNCGSVFKLTPGPGGSWKGSVVYDFPLVDEGANPYASLISDGAGNLYGTTQYGGSSNVGIVFKLARSSTGQWTRTVLYNFTGANGDGAYPVAGLVLDSAGNLYGTTQFGGNASNACAGWFNHPQCGTVFKLSPNGDGTWTESVIYRFSGSIGDGSNPAGGLVFDASGNLYGTTYFSTVSAGYGSGTVFKLTPATGGSYTESILYTFNAADGAYLDAGLAIDQHGNLYGTTNGFNSYGTVFRLSPSGTGWTESVLYAFGSSPNLADGNSPRSAGVILDAAGNLYGVTFAGGTYGQGVVYRLTAAPSGPWTETVLHSFTGLNGDGAWPQGNLVFDNAGNLYASTAIGGTNGGGCYGTGCGTAFKLTPASSGKWTEQVLYRFTGGNDGGQPYAGLVFGFGGYLYGTTSSGGTGNQGTVFQIRP